MLGYLKAVFSEALTPCLLLYLSIEVALTLPVPSASSGVTLHGGSHAVLGRVESRFPPEFLPKFGSELH